MEKPADTDWFGVRVSVETLLRLTQTLQKLSTELRDGLPPGTFHPETNEPLNLQGEIEAFTFLIESEYLDGLSKSLEQIAGRLSRDVPFS